MKFTKRELVKRISQDTNLVSLGSMHKQGVLINTLMKDYGLSKTSVYRYLGNTPSEALYE